MNAEFTLAETNCTEPIATTCVYSEGYLYASFTVTRAARSHSGNATCSTPDTCDYCGITYEMPDNHAYEWKNDNGNHWQECSYNSNHKTNQGICGGGYATCAVSGTCAICGGSYKDTQAHDYIYTANDNTITEICKNDCGHSETATLTATDATYTGSAITTGASVTYSDGWAGSQEHGEITYSNNLNAGTATAKVTVEGKELTITFKINEVNISGAAVTLNPTSGTYTGTAYNPSVSVTLDGFGTLVEGTDYTLSWNKTGFTNADTYTVTVIGKGNYSGTKTATFTIDPANIKPAIVILDQNTFVYDGQPHKPTATVTFDSATLTEGVDYEVCYLSSDQIMKWENGEPVKFFGTGKESCDSINAGRYYAVAYGKGNYTTGISSFVYAEYTIEKATVTVPTIASKVYNGSVQTADIADTDLYTVVKNEGGTGVKENGYYDVVLELKDSENYKWSTTDNARVTLQFKITRAENEWTVIPSITGWTYGEAAKAPVGEAKFGEVSVEYSGTANDGTTYNNTTAPTKAGNYTATFIVQETEDYKGLETSVDFTIAKANYNMRGAKWNYTEPFRYDGKEHKVEVIGLPAGVTVESYENNAATAVSDYYAKVKLAYDANNYNAPTIGTLGWSIYNEWAPTEYTATTLNGNGWLNSDFIITANDGYKVSLTNTADGDWKDDLSYSGETADGSVTFYLKNETDGTISLSKTITYKLDKTASTGKVEFANRTGWEEFVNTISFGLFYKDEVTVKATANDNLSGIDKIEYASADKAMTLEEVIAITDWTVYNGEFGVTLEDAKKFVYFIRITDKAGNVTYLSTDGAVYDTTAPVIEGIENGTTYYTTQKVTVTEKNVASIKLNGEDAGTNITLDGNKDATYTIEVIDKAGNSTTVTVTMKPIKDVAGATENLSNGNVTSANEQALKDLVTKLDELLADDDLTDGERETLEQHKAIAESLLETIEDTKAEIARINEELNKYNGNTVNSDDAAALEQLGKDIKALTDGNNLTDAERTALTEDAGDVAAMQKTVADTTAENKRISDAVDGYDLATVTSNDKAGLEQLLADINEQLQSTNLTEEEISELNGDKKAVEDLLAKIKGTDELIDKLTEDMDGYSEDTVKSTDKDAIEQIIEDIDALLETENLTDAEEKGLEDAKAKAEGLLDTIEDAAEATTSENTEKVGDVTAENVTPENKTDLEKAKEDLEKALEDNGGNYTDDEKKAIEDEIKRIDDALTVIENVEAVEELIGKLPESITKNDEDAIKAAEEAYNALTDYEKSLVDADAKKALDDAKAALAELNKPTDTNSPQTGDNSNMFLWIALLFISGGAVITLTVVDRKRRMASKR